MKKYVIILLAFYLNSISALYAENNNKNKIDFDWFNSEEYKMIKKWMIAKLSILMVLLALAIRITRTETLI